MRQHAIRLPAAVPNVLIARGSKALLGGEDSQRHVAVAPSGITNGDIRVCVLGSFPRHVFGSTILLSKYV